jgi:hypothetical protein
MPPEISRAFSPLRPPAALPRHGAPPVGGHWPALFENRAGCDIPLYQYRPRPSSREGLLLEHLHPVLGRAACNHSACIIQFNRPRPRPRQQPMLLNSKGRQRVLLGRLHSARAPMVPVTRPWWIRGQRREICAWLRPSAGQEQPDGAALGGRAGRATAPGPPRSAADETPPHTHTHKKRGFLEVPKEPK